MTLSGARYGRRTSPRWAIKHSTPSPHHFTPCPLLDDASPSPQPSSRQRAALSPTSYMSYFVHYSSFPLTPAPFSTGSRRVPFRRARIFLVLYIYYFHRCEKRSNGRLCDVGLTATEDLARSSADAEIARHESRWAQILLPPKFQTSQFHTLLVFISIELRIARCYKIRVGFYPVMCPFTPFVVLRDHNSPTLQTDGRTDGRHARSINATSYAIASCRAYKRNLFLLFPALPFPVYSHSLSLLFPEGEYTGICSGAK